PHPGGADLEELAPGELDVHVVASSALLVKIAPAININFRRSVGESFFGPLPAASHRLLPFSVY
ncbi:MAG TPA: hypothetical protein VFB20_00260, partial [Burkholderiales bacterium]|nr:hypothetical protein [Burkholderiales bacterium]